MNSRDTSNHDDDRSAELSRLILGYLYRHPRSRDTLDGAVDWWLLNSDIRRERERVERTLKRLVRRGLVQEIEGPDRQRHYALAPDALDEVRRLIEGADGPARDDGEEGRRDG